MRGLLNGSAKVWDLQGRLILVERYLLGEPHGIHTEWYPNGRKMIQRRYVRGWLHGLVRCWFENGSICRRERFHLNTRVDYIKEWFPSGFPKYVFYIHRADSGILIIYSKYTKRQPTLIADSATYNAKKNTFGPFNG